MTGPMSTSAPPSVGPTFIRPAMSQSRSTSGSAILPTGTATLPAMQRSPAQPKADGWTRLHRLVEVGVGHDDQVVLGPAGRLHALAVPRAGLVDVLRHGRRADERDRRHQGVRRAARRRIPCRRGRC